MDTFSGGDVVVVMSATAKAYNLAEQTFDEWLADHGRCGWARTFEICTAKLRNKALGRVAAVLGHPSPAAASRRWIADTGQAWAPLEVMFPSHEYGADSGVSGELALRTADIVDCEYAFLLPASHGMQRALEWLEADQQWLSLDLALGTTILTMTHANGESEDWLDSYLAMSLALAEHNHRQALGLEVLLAETVVQGYLADIAQKRRQLQSACRSTPCLVSNARSRAAA